MSFSQIEQLFILLRVIPTSILVKFLSFVHFSRDAVFEIFSLRNISHIQKNIYIFAYFNKQLQSKYLCPHHLVKK